MARWPKRSAAGPQAARDVGVAMARNPVALIIPCHRVLAAGGKVGGFSAPGGAAAKARMLALEGVRVGAPEPPAPRRRSCRWGCEGERAEGNDAIEWRRSAAKKSLLHQREQGARRLHLAALRAVRARARVPRVDVKMRPGFGVGDEALQEQRRGDRAGERAAGGIGEIGDLAGDHLVVGVDT